MEKSIKLSEIAESFEGMIRWVDNDGKREIWEPFEDYEWDDLDAIINNFVSARARFAESLGVVVHWGK